MIRRLATDLEGGVWMDFSVWTLFVDVGLAALLLLLGLVVRARVGPVQRAFLPANVLAWRGWRWAPKDWG